MKNITYLCGGINGLNDADAKDWREVAKSLLQTDTLDPMRRDYRGKEDQSVNEIVQGDLEDIGQSNYILVNASKASWGTAMEMVYAFSYSMKPIIAFTNGATISPWLKYHADQIVNTVEDAVEIINKIEEH